MIIRGVRSPIQPKKESVLDIARGFQQVAELESQLRALIANLTTDVSDAKVSSKEELVKVIKQFRSESETKFAKTLQEMSAANAGRFQTLFGELNARINEAVSAVEHAKTIQKGDPGLPGAAAVTPQRGIDYFTSEDVQILVQMVLNQIRQPKDGNDAVITDELMQKHLDKFIKEKKIKVGHIDGMEQTLAPIRSLAAGFRGGGDTVAAGSNITISTSNGVKTISSSGGAGSGYQAPTSGTVDGSNATFVFATAPSVIVVDQGRAMQKTSSDGTVNWTGTTTVVLTIAPVSDIYATA